MGDQNLLSRDPSRFERHVKPMVKTSGKRPVEKNIAESLSQHDEKHVVQLRELREQSVIA
jgi:hypothetical protein